MVRADKFVHLGTKPVSLVFKPSKQREEKERKAVADVSKKVRWVRRIKTDVDIRRLFTYNLPRFQNWRDTEAEKIVKAFAMPDDVEYISYCYFKQPTLGDLFEHIRRYDNPSYKMVSSLMGIYTAGETAFDRNEMCSDSRVWSLLSQSCCSPGGMDTYPGIKYRKLGWRTKDEAWSVGLEEAMTAIGDIVRNINVEIRPCALFGRGKVIEGSVDTTTGVGKGFGRMVMCPDLRDHIISFPHAERWSEYHKECWKTTNVMVGMSWVHRGGTVFLYNILMDMIGGERLNMFEEPSSEQIIMMDAKIEDRLVSLQHAYTYYCLDLSRQDSTINAYQLEFFFTRLYKKWHTDERRDQRYLSRLLRWIRMNLIHTVISLPDGSLYIKNKGNVSGNALTTYINSDTCLWGIETVLIYLLGVDGAKQCVKRVYGDNMLLCIPNILAQDITIDDIADAFDTLFAQTINKDESYVCKNLIYTPYHEPWEMAEFLKRHVGLGGVVWRPERRACETLVIPDSIDRSDEGALSRCCGVLTDNPFNPVAAKMAYEYATQIMKKGILEAVFSERDRRVARYKLGADVTGGMMQLKPILYYQQLYTLNSHELTMFNDGSPKIYVANLYRKAMKIVKETVQFDDDVFMPIDQEREIKNVFEYLLDVTVSRSSATTCFLY